MFSRDGRYVGVGFHHKTTRTIPCAPIFCFFPASEQTIFPPIFDYWDTKPNFGSHFKKSRFSPPSSHGVASPKAFTTFWLGSSTGIHDSSNIHCYSTVPKPKECGWGGIPYFFVFTSLRAEESTKFWSYLNSQKSWAWGQSILGGEYKSHRPRFHSLLARSSARDTRVQYVSFF